MALIRPRGAQAGLRLCYSYTTKSGFLSLRLKLVARRIIDGGNFPSRLAVLLLKVKFADHLLDNSQYSKFSFGEVYRRIYGRKFSLTATRKRSRKT